MGGSAAADPSHGREELLAALEALPPELDRTLSGHPVEALVRPASDGGWAVIDNLCHLRDWEEVFLERARAIAMFERPELPAYDDELWPLERDYRGQDPFEVLQRFRSLRGDLVSLLQQLPPESWARSGIHGVQGEITLRWLAEQARQHGEEHLLQIRQALG